MAESKMIIDNNYLLEMKENFNLFSEKIDSKKKEKLCKIELISNLKNSIQNF